MRNNNFWILFKKEFQTITRDRKSFFSFILMSLLLTPVLIVGIGALDAFQKQQLEKEDIVIAIDDKSGGKELTNYIQNSDIVKVVSSNNYEKDLEDKKIKGYLEVNVAKQIITTRYVYDQTSNVSAASLGKVQMLVLQFAQIQRASILKEYNLTEEQLNPVIFNSITLQEVQNKPAQSSFVLFFLPYIILIGLIQGAAQFAIELTAGEKEKNTLATTLSLNASRITIGLAKIGAILVFSLLSLILNVSSLTIAFSIIPQDLFGASTTGSAGSPFGQLHITPEILFQIFLVLLPLSFLIAAVLILLGIYARNAKEGGLYTLPLLFGAIFVGLSGQAFDANTSQIIFAIPLLGQVAMIKQILLGQFIPINFLITLISTILLFVLVLYICVKMFTREEVIFRQ